jgi:hypothetical protein
MVVGGATDSNNASSTFSGERKSDQLQHVWNVCMAAVTSVWSLWGSTFPNFHACLGGILRCSKGHHLLGFGAAGLKRSGLVNRCFVACLIFLVSVSVPSNDSTLSLSLSLSLSLLLTPSYPRHSLSWLSFVSIPHIPIPTLPRLVVLWYST